MPSVYGNRNFDMNRGAVFEDTTGVRPSRPLHVGGYSRTEERERLRSTYTTFHDRKLGYHDRRTDILSKPSSLRLLAGTNEFAEDLTGQRLPLNASHWRSETQANYVGSYMRPGSAPARRYISMMDNQEPVFGRTHQMRDPQLKDIYPHQPLQSVFQERDMYQTSYSFCHRPFASSEMQAASHWNDNQRLLPWLQDPVINFKLQCRLPTEKAHQKLQPTEAQLATLPHYTNPQLLLNKSESQFSYKNPYGSSGFYFEEPNKVGKPSVPHLERSFIN